MNNHFRSRSAGPRLSPSEADRQGRISTLAFTILGREEAIAFLNTPNDELGGRPLDVAIRNDEGLNAITQAIKARGSNV
ncbi:MAG: antitoxin Xre/MbcA/ParS toxin-binding domain-containing protein [Sphingobium sp.]